jgi:anti-sigma B factor antagonist
MAANPATPTPQLNLQTEKTSAGTVVHVTGRIVSATTEQLQTAIRALIPENKWIVLDLTNASYVDSSGLGTLVGLYISCKRGGCELKLVNLTQRLKDLFHMTNLASVFEGHGDIADYRGL